MSLILADSCPVYRVMQHLKRSTGAITGLLTRDTIGGLSANFPRGVKGIYVRPPRNCPKVGTSLVYYGYPSQSGLAPLQHENIAQQAGLPKDADTETHMGFRIVSTTIVFGDDEDSHYITIPRDGASMIAISSKHRRLLNEKGEINITSLMTEIEVPTAERFMRSNVYGYLLPKGVGFGEAWVILGEAGMNGNALHYKLASDMLRAIAASVQETDFFVFDFHTSRQIMLPVRNCISADSFPNCPASDF